MTKSIWDQMYPPDMNLSPGDPSGSSGNDIIKNRFFVSAFSVDCVVFGFDESQLKVLNIHRGVEPFKGMWAVPGDLVYPDESLEDAIERVLKELTGLENIFMAPVDVFGKVDRHPMGRVITIAYYSLIRIQDYNRSLKSNNQFLSGSVSADQAQWFSINEVPDLAFDHTRILEAALAKIRQQARTEPIGLELLPEKFTLTELQTLYEAIFEVELDTRNFRKKFLGMGLLTDLKETQKAVAHRPAKLYKFDPEKYEAYKLAGFRFDP